MSIQLLHLSRVLTRPLCVQGLLLLLKKAHAVFGEGPVTLLEWGEFHDFLMNVLIMDDRILVCANYLEVRSIDLMLVVQAYDSAAFLKDRIEIQKVPRWLRVVNQMIFLRDDNVLIVKAAIYNIWINLHFLSASELIQNQLLLVFGAESSIRIRRRSRIAS